MMPKNDLLELEIRLISLTNQLNNQKKFKGEISKREPQIALTITTDLEWSAEVFSNVLNPENPTRFHNFKGESYEDLIKQIEKQIQIQEDKLQSWKK